MAKVPSVEQVSVRSLAPSYSLPPTIPTDNYANGLISAVVQREAKRIAEETEAKLREAYDRGFADGFGSATGANRAISEGAL
jgi:hypothetical protein